MDEKSRTASYTQTIEKDDFSVKTTIIVDLDGNCDLHSLPEGSGGTGLDFGMLMPASKPTYSRMIFIRALENLKAELPIDVGFRINQLVNVAYRFGWNDCLDSYDS